MTNGEKIKEIFPDSHINEMSHTVWVGYEAMSFKRDWWNAEYKEPTTKNDLAVECINRAELLKAMDTWDKFGNDPILGLIPLRTPALQDRYVPYVRYDDMVNCVKGMPSVTPQYPRKGYLSIDDVMSVFDDFMCGEVDEDGTETFLEMLKDRAESEVNNERSNT